MIDLNRITSMLSDMGVLVDDRRIRGPISLLVCFYFLWIRIFRLERKNLLSKFE